MIVCFSIKEVAVNMSTENNLHVDKWNIDALMGIGLSIHRPRLSMRKGLWNAMNILNRLHFD